MSWEVKEGRMRHTNAQLDRRRMLQWSMAHGMMNVPNNFTFYENSEELQAANGEAVNV